MVQRIAFIGSTVFAASLLAFSVLASAADLGDEAKLKELEQAMKSPTEAAVVKKPRTRAIVFDNDQSPAAAPAVETKTERLADCNALPPNVKTVPVDFAIQFRVGSSEVAPSSEETLRQIAKILALSPDRCVLVEGHSDASGNPDANMALSRDRAASVVKFIVGRAGMDPSRLVSIGKGQTEPLKNLDPRDQKNRRVVFKVAG